MTTTLIATTNRFVALVVAVACRQCNARAGDVCRSVNGQVTSYPHMKRLDDAGVPIELISKGDAYLAAATAVVLGRIPRDEELELARQRGLSTSQPWVQKAIAGVDLHRRRSTPAKQFHEEWLGVPVREISRTQTRLFPEEE